MVFFNYDNTFIGCSNLKHLWIEGTLNSPNVFNLASSPLDAESIAHTISILYDGATGRTISFKQSAVDSAFETAEGLADGSTSEEWLTLVATKPNWAISLA